MGKRDTLCPYCGAYSPKQCDLIADETAALGFCPWEEFEDDEEEDDEEGEDE